MNILWKFGFDRSFSKGWKRQVGWLLGIAILLYFIFVVLDLAFQTGLHLRGVMRLFITQISPFLEPYEPNSSSTEFGLLTFSQYELFRIIISLCGRIIFSGMLLSIFVNILKNRSEEFKNGLVYKRYKHHIVILGYNDMVAEMIARLSQSKQYSQDRILIVTNGDIAKLRERVALVLPKQTEYCVNFQNGLTASKRDLQRACVAYAKEVFIIGEQNDPEHDSTNLSAVELIAQLTARRTDKLRCNVMIEYQSSFAVFQSAVDLSDNIRQRIEFRPFNPNELWCQRVLISEQPKRFGLCDSSNGQNEAQTATECCYPPLDREPIDEKSDKYVHLIVVGMTRMGLTMARTAAHIAHFPNYATKGKRTLITFVDCTAKQKMESMIARYDNLFRLSHWRYENTNDHSLDSKWVPQSKSGKKRGQEGDFLDIEWEFIDGRIESEPVRAMIEKSIADRQQIVTIAICFNKPSRTLSTGLFLPMAVYDSATPVLINQPNSETIIKLAQQSYRYRNIRAFGMTNLTLNIDRQNTNIEYGQLINFLYEYFYANNTDYPTVIPDREELHRKWTELMVVEQWSNIYQVLSIPTKLRSLGFNADQTEGYEISDQQAEMLSRVEHNRWNIERLLLGSRTFESDSQREQYNAMDSHSQSLYRKKTLLIHPCIVAYDDLSEFNKHLDKNISNAFLKIAGTMNQTRLECGGQTDCTDKVCSGQ